VLLTPLTERKMYKVELKKREAAAGGQGRRVIAISAIHIVYLWYVLRGRKSYFCLPFSYLHAIITFINYTIDHIDAKSSTGLLLLQVCAYT